jgi:FdhD protein
LNNPAIAAPDEVTEIARDGSRHIIHREWVPEAAIAMEFNGLAYAVMMASPYDLEDFVTGFALAEGLAAKATDLTDIDVANVEHGYVIRVKIAGLGTEQLAERMRKRVAESSCGLCGIENLEALSKPLPQVATHQPIEAKAIFAAVADLPRHQRLNHRTGSAHAAAYADSAGAIIMVREDVGRHNAMDKLIGALAAGQHDPSAGFFISSARCSYEIVEKTVKAGGTCLVTISLPTSLAIDRARSAGLSLYCLARGDSVLYIA